MTVRPRADAERLFLLGDRLADAGRDHDAWQAFLRSARKRHSGSQLNLAVMYSDGRGTRRSRTKARHWLLKALHDPGSAGAAASNLGILYLGRRSFSRARKWLERAVDLGDDDARLRLGQLILAVYGDPVEALDQFHRLQESAVASVAGNEAGRSWRGTTESIMARQEVQEGAIKRSVAAQQGTHLKRSAMAGRRGARR
jgi:TPR repeat protein